jgi:parallel beta-helix repeat protein
MGVQRNSLILMLIFFLLFVSIPEINVAKAEPKTIVVPDDFSTIQGAIDSSGVGDTVFVKSGTYYESIFIDRSISLVGENPAATTIIGDYRLNGTVVLIRQDNVNITGFTVQPSTFSRSRRGVHLLHVSHCAVFNNIFLENCAGVWLYGSSETNSTGNIIDGPSDLVGGCGIDLDYSPNNWICENIVEDNDCGIALSSSQGNTLYNNTITNNHSTGLSIRSDDNNITNNVVRNQKCGISLSGSNNILRSNKMSNNTSNFYFGWEISWDASKFVNDVDTSNTAEGKPIIYWVNEQDRKVPENAVFVALVNCANITVENLNLSNNGQGIVVASTINSSITQNSIEVPDHGILIHSSFGITITNNTMVDGATGIHLVSSSENMITNNTITKRVRGIELDASNENIITGNIISGGSFGGIDLDGSKRNIISINEIADCRELALMFWNNASENKFYLNSFINNTKNAVGYYHGLPEEIVFPTNIWDVDLRGNYWSDYNGRDNDGDGIGDTPYVINENNQDNYPLMNPSVISEFPDDKKPAESDIYLITIAVVIVLAIIFGVAIYRRKKM